MKSTMIERYEGWELRVTVEQSTDNPSGGEWCIVSQTICRDRSKAPIEVWRHASDRICTSEQAAMYKAFGALKGFIDHEMAQMQVLRNELANR
ncbi:hypothetical protein [Paraburkholderia caribensis]|uniref:hypothetical protein n=1 Tax=Paraburkholderia caribensis TaxID=75105 RepID=UPI001CAEF643|nr:hypothetical protein [Paraburkholderia caribensis]CAG9256084.1 hypothetical protein PCAR4_40215 [Paraburkholderia caribensis]